MASTDIAYLYLLLILFQIFHIFEEIALEAYKLAGSLVKYLLVASVLVTINFVALYLLLRNLPAGYPLAFLGALFGIANGLVHVVGYARTRSFRGTVGAGMFTGIPLALVGAVVLYALIGAVTS
jgi:hypothetical protein